MKGPAAQRAAAHFAGRLATGLVEVADLTARPEALQRGWWAVVATFEGAITGYRFADVRPAALPPARVPWVRPGRWTSSMSRQDYVDGVLRIREHIAAGTVYQVNLCRLLTAELPAGADPLALAHRLGEENPAPYQGFLHTGTDWVVTASPELFLRRTGDTVLSGPVKGTAAPGEPFSAKDFPENIMITDLVRNDLGRVARPGGVRVTSLLRREDHPGLQHLVSDVQAELRRGTGWDDLLAATFPPGSVSGAPKHTALQIIRELERVPRGPYCGAIGWVDGDRGTAELAVGIRTFFSTDDGRRVHFGTGAGITYPSDPDAEWRETELKASRLIAAASGVGGSAASAGVLSA
ncbi:anthranilate synthase component I family protein [Nakamurella sp. YIM 132087]|uniref:Anthranilate synthase component I family protein n=1 Tax=Nakamurella alba TaxID=2665158 RepID=A0A7K1FPB8_9ACTN|nr:anthranilate synthase component I family protein [Nakamurella alba]MTD15995.1 anthranilate synthase component I family protein [Nakamurella alba]